LPSWWPHGPARPAANSLSTPRVQHVHGTQASAACFHSRTRHAEAPPLLHAPVQSRPHCIYGRLRRRSGSRAPAANGRRENRRRCSIRRPAPFPFCCFSNGIASSSSSYLLHSVLPVRSKAGNRCFFVGGRQRRVKPSHPCLGCPRTRVSRPPPRALASAVA
jgi:hypothetical protein